jgi:peptide deformylase
VNPVIIPFIGDLQNSNGYEMVTREEGCLSFPGAAVPVMRRERTKVMWLTPQGEELEHEFGEWDGRCIQHEVDHLDGKTVLDHLGEHPREREEFLAKVAEAARK